MEPTEAIKRLGQLCEAISRTQEKIRRKRSMRPSEKAMAASSYEQDKEALRLGIAALMKLASAIAVGLLLAGPAPARADVECFRTAVPSEVTVCANPDLVRLDSQASSLFFAIYQTKNRPEQADLAASEHAWVHERNACGLDRSCIAAAYQSHIEFLCGLLLQTQGQHEACQGVEP